MRQPEISEVHTQRQTNGRQNLFGSITVVIYVDSFMRYTQEQHSSIDAQRNMLKNYPGFGLVAFWIHSFSFYSIRDLLPIYCCMLDS